MAERSPRVSVVIATYNRPRVLACAMRSVLAQTFSDLELIVVGDRCSGETGEAVASFTDPRVRYHNMPVNVGEQSGPNNVGVGLARGSLIAFLNHDDLWFPDHLAAAVREMDRTSADLVFAPFVWVGAAPPEETAAGRFGINFGPRARDGHYDPATTMAPASTMVFTRAMFDQVGPWRPGAQLHAESSQDFLFRAWRQRKRLVIAPGLSVLLFGSGMRRQVYVTDPAWEQTLFLQRLATDPQRLRSEIVARIPPRIHAPWPRSWVNHVGKAGLRLMGRLGVSPRELLIHRRDGYGRGDLLRSLYRRRGLPERPT